MTDRVGAAQVGAYRGGSSVRIALSFVVMVFVAGDSALATAADVERPGFQPHRFDEDWRPYCRAVEHPVPVDRAKCLRLGEDTLVSLGADLRVRLEAVDDPEFGVNQSRDQVALFRAMTHVDLRVGRVLRVFTQFGSFFETGREDARAPTDVDRFDLIQGFADLDFDVGGGSLTLRGGRQEMSLGASRLVGVREGANVRRAFAGGRAFWRAGDVRVDALYARPVVINPDPFDDATSGDEALWGLYSTTPVAGPLEADAYYLGYERDEAVFAAVAGREQRHSLGIRLFGTQHGFDWDVEAVGQVGEVDDQDIRAWTLASDFGYAFEAWPMKPHLGLKADVASGDRHSGDRTLGTFNALYPRFPYFSEAILVVPANIIDINLSLRIRPLASVTLDIAWNPVWRYDTSDAVYSAPLEPIAGTAGQSGRFTAHQTIAGFSWAMTRSLSLTGQYVHAVPGDALRDVGGDPVDFGTLWLTFKY